jgi:hypothetical protein
MRTRNFVKGRRFTVLFRLCLAIIVLLTLAVGGMTLNTQPVQAQLTIDGPCNTILEVPACVPFIYRFYWKGTSLDPAGIHHFWEHDTLPLLTGTKSWLIVKAEDDAPYLEICGCFDKEYYIGYTFQFEIWVTELWPGPDPEEDKAVSEKCLVTIHVNPPPADCPETINPTLIPSAWQNLPWSMTLSTTPGGLGPLQWGATGLPSGVTLDPDTGVISGTPATCGPHTVKVTVFDLGMPCCCEPIEREFILFVDCWANYACNACASYYACTTCSPCTTCSTPCDCVVEIGTGLEYGQTKVFVDSEYYATLAGGQSKIIASQPCQGRIVSVDQTVPGPDDKTRYVVIGSNYKPCTDIDNRAYFDYAKQVYIDTGSDPSGVAVPGTGWYTVGSDFSTTAPNSVDSNDTRLIFREYTLPDGNTSLNRNLVFTVNKPGAVIAKYDKYFLLTLKSDYPFVNETLWKPEGTATWNLALQPVPTPNFWGRLGARYKAVNARGSIELHEPTEVEILWKKDCTIPAIIMSVLVIVIAGLVYYFGFWRRRQRDRAAAKPAKRKRQTPTKTGGRAKPKQRYTKKTKPSQARKTRRKTR